MRLITASYSDRLAAAGLRTMCPTPWTVSARPSRTSTFSALSTVPSAAPYSANSGLVGSCASSGYSPLSIRARRSLAMRRYFAASCLIAAP